MEFPGQEKTVIIATKGLPFTGTKEISYEISAWTKTPVFLLDEILEEMYDGGGYTSTCRPSTQEDEHIQRLAFSMLCRVVGLQLWLTRTNFKCVLVESQLSFTFQLDQLIKLSTKHKPNNPHKLIILDVRLRHKHHWKTETKDCTRESNPDKKWFLPGSWYELEKVIYDYDAEAWDEHYRLMSSCHPHLKMLVLDPLLDLRVYDFQSKDRVSPFAKAIEYLLTDKEAPPAVEYRKWRKKFVEGILLKATSTITKNNIKLCSNAAGDCIFKYQKHVVGGANCRVCEQLLDGEAYICISCGLVVLHKSSCAEFEPVNLYADVGFGSRIWTFDVEYAEIQLQACKSCIEAQGFSYECGLCIFETHLKCRLMPTVVCYPSLHPHPLSIQFNPIKADCKPDLYVCEICSLAGEACWYYCVVCNSYYHLRCVHSPLQLEHIHGGHLHLMNLVVSSPDSDKDDKLVFSRDDYLDPDDFCCDVCYNDIDSHASSYRCRECPDYVAHIFCVSTRWVNSED